MVLNSAAFGISDPSKDIPNICLYPNPVGNLLNIDISESKTDGYFFTIYDITGKSLISMVTGYNREGHFQVQVKELPSGIYLLRVQNIRQGPVWTGKFVK